MSVSLRRGLIAATLGGLLAVSLITPAAIASADELPLEDTTTTVVEEQMPAEPAPEVPAEEPGTGDPVHEDPAHEEPVPEEPAEEPASRPQADDDAATDAPEGEVRTADTPTPTATSTNDPDPNAIEPGATLTVPYTVTGARIVYIHAGGDDLAVTVTLPGGGGDRLVPDFGSYHQSTTYWQGMPDGVWTLRIRNIGTSTVVPTYGLTYSTSASTLQLSSSVGAPGLTLHTAPSINGVTSPAYVVHSEVTGPDGSTSSHDLLPQVPGSSAYTYTYEGLPNGEYLARVWMTVDGVTYEETRTVRVHELETEPPVVSTQTIPDAPNAAGWFGKSVRLTFWGSDAGSGFHSLLYSVDDGPEQSANSGMGVDITGDGDHTVAYRGRDAQGNWSDGAVTTIRIDTVRPTVSLHGITDGARYDIDEEVLAEYQCSDATSGIAECVGDRPDMGRIDTSVRGDFTFTVVATDVAGNTFREVRHYSVGPADTTDPVVEADLPAQPASGWYAGPVTIGFTATDDDSGVARLHWEYTTSSGTVTGDTEESTAELTLDATGEFQVTYWAQDAAGNRSEGLTLNLAVDVDRPVIDIVEPQGEAPSILPNGHYAQNERVVVDYTCDDIGSGVDTCTGPVAAGSALPTATPGTHEFRVVATDLAGNRTENWVVYTVDAAPAPGGGNSGGPAETPRLAQTGSELLIPGVVLVAGLLAAGALLLATRRLGGR